MGLENFSKKEQERGAIQDLRVEVNGEIIKKHNESASIYNFDVLLGAMPPFIFTEEGKGLEGQPPKNSQKTNTISGVIKVL